MSDYQKMVETRCKPIANMFEDLESKPISYNQIALKFGDEWINLSHQQAEALSSYLNYQIFRVIKSEYYRGLK